MNRAPNMVGLRFGAWTVLRRAEAGKDRSAVWLCRCDCGNEAPVQGRGLRSGHSTMCLKCVGIRSRTHGMSTFAEYKIWATMKDRCLNPRSKNYEYYGARGIAVHPRWMRFEDFISDMGLRPTSKHTLDRIDDLKGYEPGNVQWLLWGDNSRKANMRRWHPEITA